MYTSFHMKGFPSHFTDHWPTSLSDDIPQLAFIISNSESKSSQYCNPIFTKTQEKYYSLTKSIRLAVLTNIRHQDQEINLLNKPISPRRLREGGAAILQALNRNHHIDILGIKLIKPLLTKRLRLPKRS